ncbi:CMGC kinase [Fusarium tjaetaba]|uniref:CMGC kinase n=1 Tax=Fusarium tjaetaba TaxID=1567544 RepID=A0A8H5R8B1_9HYPO|nr:CMGC kinase [Fusarium tjaetaba]KAF5627231.1 CMGC kinase [Fusarium tjaetaba]
MVSAKLIGALALFSLGAVEASVCKPHPSSVASSGTGTASSVQSSATESSFIETTSTAEPSLSSSDVSTSSDDVTSTLGSSTTFATLISTSATVDDVSSTTQVDVISTSGEVIESTTTAEATTTTAEPDTTTATVEATTSSAATTTAAPAPEPTFRLFTYDSQDPSLNGGIGYCKLEPVLNFYYMRFTPSSALAPTFKIDPATGAVTVVSGPSDSPGESMISTTLKGAFSSSYLQIIPEALIDTDAQEVVVCSIAEDQLNKLVCYWPGGGIADFWTCSGSWVLVQPGYTLSGDFCSDPVYKISVHAQFV